MANPMPVATCRQKQASVALPNTYHQLVSAGMMWNAVCWRMALMPRRSSSQAPMRRNIRRSPLADAQRSAEHLEPAVLHTGLVLEQRPGRRSAGHGAVGVVHAAMAGAQKQVRVA